jgi:hypothetical protein
MLCDGFVVAGDACANWRLSWKLGSSSAAVANNDDRGMPGFLVDFLSTSLTCISIPIDCGSNWART